MSRFHKLLHKLVQPKRRRTQRTDSTAAKVAASMQKENPDITMHAPNLAMSLLTFRDEIQDSNAQYHQAMDVYAASELESHGLLMTTFINTWCIKVLTIDRRILARLTFVAQDVQASGRPHQ